MRDYEQLRFNLAPVSPYSLEYFVPHSGVYHAVDALENAINSALGTTELGTTELGTTELGTTELGTTEVRFSPIYLCGASGTGKTHLLEGFRERARVRGLADDLMLFGDFGSEGTIDESEVSGFIAEFERLRSYGGLAVFAARSVPEEVCSNPHVSSRLRLGGVINLKFPGEDELRPLIESILERHNWKLSDRSVDYLLRRLPIDPLFFETILSRIERLCLEEGKPAGLGILRRALAADEADG